MLPVSGGATNNTLVPPLVCNDGLFCFDDSCSTVDGCHVTPHNCADASLCTTDSCNETTDGCDHTPVVCNDSNACTNDTCNPATGSTTVCLTTPIVCNDSNACTNDTCNPATGSTTACLTTPVVCTDNLFCSTVICDMVNGCIPGVQDEFCDDQNVCTDDSCDEAADACVNTVDNTNDPSCAPGDEICRTPGFWGTHGGVEKSSSQNITQAVLDNFGGTLSICGTIIDNTDVGNTHSALEAICVSPKGDSRLQLARQLTAAALNCGITNGADTIEECTGAGENGAAPCGGVSIEDVFNACNAACPTGTTAEVDGNTISCIGAIDCLNNGGIFDPATGDCDEAVGTSCHDRQLVDGCFDFVPPGAAGSPRACNDARKNSVLVVPPLP